MTRISVNRHTPLGVAVLWEGLADLASHVLWMRDADSIIFATGQRSGIGTRMLVGTRIGPFHTTDVVEVVGWEEERSITVRHEGRITGIGTISLRPEGTATVVTWEENLTFPWWLGGVVTGWVARPFLAGVWRGNLDRLENLLSSP